jgi:hypothetical protein
VSSCTRVSLSASVTTATIAANTHRHGGQPREWDQAALINRQLGSARNLAAVSRLLQLYPVSHVHIERKALPHLAGPEQR